MDGLKALSFSVVFLAAAPAVAQAPGGFDGTYAGVSSSAGSGSVRCPELGIPSPLIVANGAARIQSGGMDGTVAPDGSVKLHSKGGDLYQGKIDGIAASEFSMMNLMMNENVGQIANRQSNLENCHGRHSKR